MALAAGGELFHHGDTAFATIDVNGHNETHSVRSKGFRLWLVKQFYQGHAKPPSAQAMTDALATIEARAVFGGMAAPVAVRVAELDGVIFIDLADEQWRAVRVDPTGWRVVDDPPVRFLRPRGMLALPMPVRGGRVHDLRRFVNVDDDHTWTLVVTWVVAALRPRGPYPILTVNGEQGSAKSTLCRMLRALVDPNGAPLRCEPKEPRDLMIGAGNAWLLAFDNLSHLPPWLSDALCQLSTGGGFATRELYTDDGERIFDSMRPVLLNGIEDLANRSDLLDRSIIVTLPSISEDRRRSEADLWRRFNEAAPGILGGLLDAVSAGLRNLSTVRLPRLPRMADFACWATACEPALRLPGGAFLAAYSGNREQANEAAIEASPVGPVLLAFLADRDSWSGTASDLLGILSSDSWTDEKTRRQRGWPQRGCHLSGMIRRLAPNLRATGLDADFYRESHTRRRMIVLTGKEAGNTVPRVPTVPNPVREPETALAGDGGDAGGRLGALGDGQETLAVARGDGGDAESRPFSGGDGDGQWRDA